MSSADDDTTNNNAAVIKVLGVCGGIGSGKSKACELLVTKLGCVCHIEADSIAHQVYQPGSQAVVDVVKEFGSDILLTTTSSSDDEDKQQPEIDRKKLGAIVFGDPSAMATLERIVWPHVKTEIMAKIEQVKQKQQQSSASSSSSTNNIIVLEAAVLLDAGWDDLLDAVWVVQTPQDMAIQRLCQNRNFTQEEAEKRIQAQKTRRGIGNTQEEMEKGVVTAIIENTGSEQDLQQALAEHLQNPNSWKTKEQ